MSYFESKLEKGIFMIPECIKCKKIIWPPSDYCNRCFGKNNWREFNGIGIIIEFSKNKDGFFCLVEFENKIRILGKLGINTKNPEIHKTVKIKNCKINEKDYNFTLELV